MSHIYRLTDDVIKMSLGDNNVTKVYKGLDQIRPAYVPPPQYHVVTPFSGGIPSGWSGGGVSVSGGGGGIYSPGGDGYVTYPQDGGMPSLRNAYKVVINVVFALSSEQDALYVSLRTGTTINYRGRVNTDGDGHLGVGQYVYGGGDHINWDGSFGTTDKTITGELGLVEGEREGQTITKTARTTVSPYGVVGGLSDTEIDAIKGSDNLHIELIGGVVVKSIDMYIYNDVPSSPVGPGVYWNESLGLISLSDTGDYWITIADKDLGASYVGGVGYHYQWGNNCPYEDRTVIHTNSTVNTEGYGPGNYYYSTSLINNYPDWEHMDWSEPHNNDLWGGVTSTCEAAQGPCPTGYYVGVVTVWDNIYRILIALGFGERHYLPLKMHMGGQRALADTTDDTHFSFVKFNDTDGCVSPNAGAPKGWIYPNRDLPFIRPVKNTSVTPDSSWTKIEPTVEADWPMTGFEIPTSSDVNDVIGALRRLTGGATSYEFQEYLHIPNIYIDSAGGYDNRFPSTLSFWTRTTNSHGNWEYLYSEDSVSDVGSSDGSELRALRPFKSQFEMPDSTWTIIIGDLTNGGIFWKQGEGVISIYEPNGVQKTISDRNLGARTVFNRGDTTTRANSGRFYQWGNCYGFDLSEETVYNKTVDTSSYGPNNRYYKKERIRNSNASWEAVHNPTLWDPVNSGL